MSAENLLVQYATITYVRDSDRPFHVTLKAYGSIVGVYKASQLKLDFTRFKLKDFSSLHADENTRIGVIEGDCVACCVDEGHLFGLGVQLRDGDTVLHHCFVQSFVIQI